MRLKLLTDDDRGKVWCGPVVNHGDWPYCFLLRLEYTDAWEGGIDYKYHATIYAASPVAAAREIDGACKSMSVERADFDAMPFCHQCQLLMEHGMAAPLFQKTGSNQSELLKALRRELRIIDGRFSFFMDRRVNAVGDCGWDWIRGDIGHRLRHEYDREAEARYRSKVQ